MSNLNLADFYIYVIVALLPLTAFMLVCQVNPYHALVLRGILGGAAVLVYGVLGAADVALTEALVGTMLAITLYAVAVRSSMVMRLGVLRDEAIAEDDAHPFEPLLERFRVALSKYHLRLEIVCYPDLQALQKALMAKEVHATCVQRSPLGELLPASAEALSCQTNIRIRRLYDLLESNCSSPENSLIYVDTSKAASVTTANLSLPESGELPL